MAFFALTAASTAQAASLDLQSLMGKDLFTQSFLLDTRPFSGKETGLDWNVSFSMGVTSFIQPDGVELKDHTFTLMGGPDWRITRNWDVGASLALSSTPEESLQSGGLLLFGEYTIHFDRTRATPAKKNAFPADFLDDLDAPFEIDRSAGFHPTLSFRLTLGGTKMTDKPNAYLRNRFPILASLVDSITQRQLGIEVGAVPFYWGAVRLSVTGYSYDKDVRRFQAFLNTERVLSPGSAGFAASLDGLPRNSGSLSFNFLPSDDWQIDLLLLGSTRIVDGGRSRGSQLAVAHDFSSWLRAGLGLERDISDSLTQSLLLLNLSFAVR